MPLVMLRKGKTGVITKKDISPKTTKFLDSLGLTDGTEVKIIAENGGDLIVQVLETRLAISKTMALKIMVEEAV